MEDNVTHKSSLRIHSWIWNRSRNWLAFWNSSYVYHITCPNSAIIIVFNIKHLMCITSSWKALFLPFMQFLFSLKVYVDKNDILFTDDLFWRRLNSLMIFKLYHFAKCNALYILHDKILKVVVRSEREIKMSPATCYSTDFLLKHPSAFHCSRICWIWGEADFTDM